MESYDVDEPRYLTMLGFSIFTALEYHFSKFQKLYGMPVLRCHIIPDQQGVPNCKDFNVETGADWLEFLYSGVGWGCILETP